jgi:hypothetical protein
MAAYHRRVAALQQTLWDNVSALMKKAYGSENINRLAREAKLGPATIQGIKDADRSVRLSTIEKVAKAFKVEPWQLLAPGLSDEKFLDLLLVWQETDGRGRRMLLTAAEGAKATYDVGTARPERAAKAQRG